MDSTTAPRFARLQRLPVRLLRRFSALSSHPWLTKQLVQHLPFYSYSDDAVFACDGAPPSIVERRRSGAQHISQVLRSSSPASHALTRELERGLPEVQFVSAHRVPFPFRDYVQRHFPLSVVVSGTEGVRIRDLDDQWLYDLTASFGVNVFGYDFYKECLELGAQAVTDLGPVLGPFHPLIADNVRRLQAISGLDEVSFHMSGTEAVMQAVRLARYHTGRTHLVRFSGAYHGWWDGVMAATASHREAKDMYTLREMHDDTLSILQKRKNIACVLVNPLQALHPNSGSPGDNLLVNSARSARFDRAAYTRWLAKLREVCSANGIALILDEVFLGFRLAYGGAQEYFRVRADLVTYGKTLGGGLPIGAVCGSHRWMRRFRDDRPLLHCFSRGTFSSHPYVMGAMNEFLRRIEKPAIRNAYDALDRAWNERAAGLNHALAERSLPVCVAHLSSVWSVLYNQPSRFNWMFQYYLRAAGLMLGPAGSGRIILPHQLSDADFAAIQERFIAAAQAMNDDGFWYGDARASDRRINRQLVREIAGKLVASRWGGSVAPSAVAEAAPAVTASRGKGAGAKARSGSVDARL